MKYSLILKIKLVLLLLAIPLTYNACGKMRSSTLTESSLNSQSEPLQFDRTSVPEFSKTGFTLNGRCPSGSSIQILIDNQRQASAVNCVDGKFSYTIQLSGADGPRVIVAMLSGTDLRDRRDSITIFKDTTVPVLNVQNVVPTSGYLVITGTCETNLPLAFGGDILTASNATCLNGTFQASASVKTGAGAKSLQVSQTDKAGNVGTTTFSFTPDTSQPILLVNSPTAGVFVGTNTTVTGSCEPGLTVTVSGSALMQPLQLSCLTGVFSQMVTIVGGDGAKKIVAMQTDASGNKAEFSIDFFKDTTAPSISIIQPMSGIIATLSSITVSGSCESGLPVILLGSGLVSSTQVFCTGSSYSALVVLTPGNGQKTIETQQTDQAGNSTKVSRIVSSTAASSALAISQPAVGAISTGPISLTGSCDVGGSLTFSGDIIQVNDLVCSGGSFSRSLTLSSADGPKTVSIRQTLNAVISNTSRSFNKDSTPPILTIAQPAAGASIIGNFIISGSCESGLQVAITGSGITAGVNVPCASGSYSATLTATAGDGSKSFTTQQTDTAGNKSVPITRSVIRASSSSVLTVSSPVNGSAVPAVVVLSGACETGMPVVISGAGLLAGVSATCVVGMYSQAITLSTVDGPKTISIKQTDLANNVTTVNVSYIKDTVAPVLSITEPAAGTKAVTGLTLKGACETGLSVKASGAGLASEVTAACASQLYSLTITFSAGDGIKNVIVSQTDGAGNLTSLSRQFEKGETVVDTMGNFIAAKAVLTSYCLNCHKTGGQAASADFNLSSDAEFIAKGYVVPGKPDESKLIYRLLRYTGPTAGGARNMPIGGTTTTFSATSYNTLVNWVSKMYTPVVVPPTTPAGFTCNDPTLRETTLSYTLTKTQYTNTLTDLFGAATVGAAANALSTLSEDTFDAKSNNRTSILSESKATAYLSVAKAIANSVMLDNAKMTAIFGSCSVANAPTQTCIDGYLNGFAKKIFRQPLSPEEITFSKSIANRSGDYKANLRTLLTSHLQSPYFIWRLELGKTTQNSTAQTELTQYEIATRISFSAADTTPDDTLLAAATSNQLTSLLQVQEQTRRILRTARGREKTQRNLMRWSLNDTAVDFSTLPPQLKAGLVVEGLGQEMVNETKQFINYAVFDQNSNFKTLLTSKVSLASNSSLASIYGHAPVAAGSTSNFSGRRQGLLMRSSFLAYPSTRTGIIRRGVDFQKRLLCNEIPPPSSTIVDLRDDNDFTAEEKLLYTNREIIANKTKSPLCMSCHATINPTGFAFEGFDPFGRIRTQESIFDSSGLVRTRPIDSTASVPLPNGVSLNVQDAYDLVTYVATSSEGSACFSRNTFRFVNERRETDADSCQLNNMHKIVFDPNKSVFDSLVELIANDTLFLKKN